MLEHTGRKDVLRKAGAPRANSSQYPGRYKYVTPLAAYWDRLPQLHHHLPGLQIRVFCSHL